MKKLIFITILLCSIKGFGQTGYWKLDGNANDYSGSGNNGTATSITYSIANGKLNQGASFNGSSSYIRAANPSVASGDRTIMMWFKTPGKSVDQNFLLSYETPNNTTDRLTIRVLDTNEGSISGLLRVYIISAASTEYMRDSQIRVDDNKWHLAIITVSVSLDLITIYIDGSINQLTPIGTRIDDLGLNNYIRIGRVDTSNAYYFIGSQDEIIIYNTMWSVAQSKNKFSADKGFF